MLRRFIFRLSVFVAGLGLVASSLAANAQDTDKRGRKYKAPPPTARIEVTILRGTNGKPIENAAVIFHPMAGEKDKGNMELKTNEDGKAVIDVLPIGDTVRLQVIANGFQTFGQDYKIDKSEMAIEVKLNRPGADYSIYKPHPTTENDGQSVVKDGAADKPADKSADTPPGQSKDKPAEKKDAKDKPDDSAKQPDAHSSPSQDQPPPK